MKKLPGVGLMNEELLEIKDAKNKKLYLMEVIQFDEDDE